MDNTNDNKIDNLLNEFDLKNGYDEFVKLLYYTNSFIAGGSAAFSYNNNIYFDQDIDIFVNMKLNKNIHRKHKIDYNIFNSYIDLIIESNQINDLEFHHNYMSSHFTHSSVDDDEIKDMLNLGDDDTINKNKDLMNNESDDESDDDEAYYDNEYLSDKSTALYNHNLINNKNMLIPDEMDNDNIYSKFKNKFKHKLLNQNVYQYMKSYKYKDIMRCNTYNSQDEDIEFILKLFEFFLIKYNYSYFNKLSNFWSRGRINLMTNNPLVTEIFNFKNPINNREIQIIICDSDNINTVLNNFDLNISRISIKPIKEEDTIKLNYYPDYKEILKSSLSQIQNNEFNSQYDYDLLRDSIYFLNGIIYLNMSKDIDDKTKKRIYKYIQRGCKYIEYNDNKINFSKINFINYNILMNSNAKLLSNNNSLTNLLSKYNYLLNHLNQIYNLISAKIDNQQMLQINDALYYFNEKTINLNNNDDTSSCLNLYDIMKKIIDYTFKINKSCNNNAIIYNNFYQIREFNNNYYQKIINYAF